MLSEDEKRAIETVARGAVHSSPESDEALDPRAERRLLMKLDLIIFPAFFLIYMMSFLDRINIGNAKIQGMVEELHLYGNKYNVALFVSDAFFLYYRRTAKPRRTKVNVSQVYFVSYILFEVPSNMIVRKVRPSVYISTLMLCWGVINMCMGFIHSYAALCGLRVLLGIFEAGVLPAIIYVTSMYYKRHEFQKRFSFFFCSTVIAGAFGGLLAYLISSRLHGAHGLAAWRWIFIIEGAMTSIIAIFAFALIIDWPEQTRFLNAREKSLLARRLALDVGDSCRMDTLNRTALKLIFTDYKIYLGAMAYLGIGVTGYAGSFFLPTILVEFKYTTVEAQVHTIPVYVFTAGIMLLAAWASDRLKHRSGFILAATCMTTVGYAMLLAQEGKSRDFKFSAVFLIIGGGFMATPIVLGWLQNNLSGHWKRSFGAAIQVMLGNLSGIVGSNIFLQSEQPQYQTGYRVAMASMWFGSLATVILAVLMWRENKKRDAGERDYILRELTDEDLRNLGDKHPSFRFTL